MRVQRQEKKDTLDRREGERPRAEQERGLDVGRGLFEALDAVADLPLAALA